MVNSLFLSPSHPVGSELYKEKLKDERILKIVSIPPSGLGTNMEVYIYDKEGILSPSHPVGSEPQIAH